MAVRNRLFIGLFALAAWSQTSDKVFYFAHLNSPKEMQELTNVVRSIGDIRNASIDVASRSLTVKGTADQIAAAGWLIAELDQTGSVPGAREFLFNDVQAPRVQIVYLSHVDAPQDLQAIVNVVRSIADIQRVLPIYEQKAVVMRGSPAQVKAAGWLLGVLDRPAGPEAVSAPLEYKLPATDWDARGGLIVQVTTLTRLQTPQAMQDVTNAIRSLSDIQRCFPVSSQRSLVMRASDGQIALANWLLKELDGPDGQGTKEFQVGGPGNQVAQVAYVNAATPQSLQETVNQIRSETQILRVYPFNPQRAVAMRGTADQLARAQHVVQSRQGQ